MQQLARATPIIVQRETPDAPLLVTAGGYGYGLGASQTCWTAHLVGHTGGLPGWGSSLRWLPESGVGVVAMMNVTYGGPALGESMQEALLALHRSGGLTPRAKQPSAALREVMGQVNGLLARWDDGAARKLAAENFFLDTPLESRRNEFQELSSRHGPCRPDGALEAETALRGHWLLRCERGTVRFYATIAPVPPARLQELDASSVLPLDARMASAAKSVATLASGWNEEAATKLLASAVDRAKLRQQLGAVAALHGTCKPGELSPGTGRPLRPFATTAPRSRFKRRSSWTTRAGGSLRSSSRSRRARTARTEAAALGTFGRGWHVMKEATSNPPLAERTSLYGSAVFPSNSPSVCAVSGCNRRR